MKMAEIQRKYVIPLRKAWRKAPIYRRTRRAKNALREFVQKHMKVDDVKIGKYLNEKLWEKGPRNPPHKVEVDVTKIEEKDKEPYAKVEIVNAPKEEKKIKKVKKKSLISTLKEKVTESPKKEETKKEEAKKEELEKEKKEVLETKAPKAQKEAKQKELKKEPTPEVQEKSRQEKVVSLPNKK